VKHRWLARATGKQQKRGGDGSPLTKLHAVSSTRRAGSPRAAAGVRAVKRQLFDQAEKSRSQEVLLGEQEKQAFSAIQETRREFIMIGSYLPQKFLYRSDLSTVSLDQCQLSRRGPGSPRDACSPSGFSSGKCTPARR